MLTFKTFSKKILNKALIKKNNFNSKMMPETDEDVHVIVFPKCA